MRIINEPTAAAIAYGLDNKSDITRKIIVLVFDLGGGTFDVSLLTIAKGGTIEVKAVGGDTHLGGEDFDNRMVDHCAQEFKRRWNKDLTGNKRALGRLRCACEKAKRILSCSIQTSIEIDGLHEGIDFSMKFSRAKFEELNMSFFDKCIATANACLSDAKMKKSCVKEVILVGGSTRIPKIQCMLQECFERKELRKSVNPDEAVAYGAAVMAAKLSGNNDKRVRDLVLLDVTPLSLGQETKGEKLTVKEHASKDNHLLGEYTLSGLPLAPKGITKFRNSFEIDNNGILTVTSEILSTRKRKKVTITNENGRLSKEEVERMIEDADKYKQEDQEYMKKAAAANALDDCIYDIKNMIKSMEHGERLKKMKKAVDYTTNWLDHNQAPSLDELQHMKEHLEAVCMPTF
ncbi:hypothetical protein Lser_V15G42865 [Lactuca serriola]